MGSDMADHLPPGRRQLSPQGWVNGVSDRSDPISPRSLIVMSKDKSYQQDYLITLSKIVDAINTCNCSHPIGFRHGRIVKGGINEILQCIRLTFLAHDRLTDMDNL